MTCNGKAISKVMGWGMILKMIRDKNVTQQGRDGNRWDRLRTLGILRVWCGRMESEKLMRCQLCIYTESRWLCIPVYNVDGTANDAGMITDLANIILHYENHSEHTRLDTSWEVEPDLGVQLAVQSQPRDQLADKGCQDVSLPTTMFNLQSWRYVWGKDTEVDDFPNQCMLIRSIPHDGRRG
jgi:hypothetical protein